jgi:sugar lactone lactonase YvrE
LHLATEAQIITTAAGGGTANPGNGGLAVDAILTTPISVAADAAGNIYICEREAHRVRKVSPDGIISLFAGNGTAGYSGDGGLAVAASLNRPECITTDRYNNVYIGDETSIRMVNTAGVISTITGTGTKGFNGDGGPSTATQVSGIREVLVDRRGQMWFVDAGNRRIRKIDLTGTVTTIAGTGLSSPYADYVPATSANLINLMSLTIGSDDALYLIESNMVRVISPEGIIITVAGKYNGGFTPDGGFAISAELGYPIDVRVDANDNLYISEARNRRIRKINTYGRLTTVCGNGDSSSAGDGGPAIMASMICPAGMTITPSGTMYICDYCDGRVRRVDNVVSVADVAPAAYGKPSLKVWPNPNTGTFQVLPTSGQTAQATLRITDIFGREVYNCQLPTNSTKQVHITLPAGLYVATANVGETFCSEYVRIVQ